MFFDCKCNPNLLLRIDSRLKTIINLMIQIKRGEEIMTAELDALKAEVTHVKDVELSAVTLIQGLAAQIAAAHDDPAALLDLTSQLHDSAEALAAAIVAGTPAAPAPVVVAPVVDPAAPVV